MEDKNIDLVKYNFDMIKDVIEQIGSGAYGIKSVNFIIKTKDIEMSTSISSLYMDNIAAASLSVGKNILDDFSNETLPDDIFDIIEFTDEVIPSLHSMSVIDGGRNVFKIYLKPSDEDSRIIGYCKVTVGEDLIQEIVFFTELNPSGSIDIFLPKAMLYSSDLCREFLHSNIYICKEK